MGLRNSQLRRRSMGLLATVGILVGVMAPAYASGSKSTHIYDKKDGYASARWKDDAPGAKTRATTRWCTREYRMRLRKDRNGLPDPVVGSEWINCLSYDDAVHSDNKTPKAKYHYDIGGMDGSCFCDYRTTASVDVYW